MDWEVVFSLRGFHQALEPEIAFPSYPFLVIENSQLHTNIHPLENGELLSNKTMQKPLPNFRAYLFVFIPWKQAYSKTRNA